jgi:hypothetical protein
MKALALFLTLLPALMLAACSPNAPTVPCPVCYEDEWSREPFPGEAKQHIKPLTPESIKANGGVVPRMPSATSY